MKKVLSLTLALVMLISCFGTFTANAATPTKVNNQITKAAEYIANNSDMSKLTYADFWLLVDAGYDMSAYKDAYLANLKSTLVANEGKIMLEGTIYDENYNPSGVYYYEDIAAYAAVIATLKAMGLNPAAYEGYDLVTTFKNFDLSGVSNPYSYRLAVYTAYNVLNDRSYAVTIANDMVDRFYYMGQGMSYYDKSAGYSYFSCDNTGYFLAALAPLYNEPDFADCIDDACGVIKSYTKENGAFSDPFMAPAENADSTALAMLGFASVHDIENAYWYYQKLIDNFYNSSTGAFTSPNYYTGEIEDNLYATKEGLMGLIQLAKIADLLHVYDVLMVTNKAGFNHNGERIVICPICSEGKTETIPAIGKITLSKTSYVYDGKAKTPAITVTDINGTPISSENYKVEYSANKNVGTGKVTVSFDNNYTGTKALTFKITKAAQPLTVKAKSAKTVTVKSKKATIAAKDALTVSKAQGTVTYTKASGKKYFSVNKKNGKITVKKGTPKGTYKVKIKVTAAGNSNYKSGNKTVTITIKVK